MQQLITASVEVQIDDREPFACHTDCEYLKASDAFCFLFRQELHMARYKHQLMTARCQGCLGEKAEVIPLKPKKSRGWPKGKPRKVKIV